MSPRRSFTTVNSRSDLKATGRDGSSSLFTDLEKWMHEITLDDAGMIGGAGVLDWFAGQLAGMAFRFVVDAVFSGQVDYAGLAEQQGSSYNMLGA
jgi:hypothetical protein